MDERDFLERLQEQFGFTQFVLVGLTPSDEGEKEADDMHIISNVSAFSKMLLLNEAMANLIDDSIDDSPSVH